MENIVRLHAAIILLLAGALTVLLWQDFHKPADTPRNTYTSLMLVVPPQHDAQSNARSGEDDPDDMVDDPTANDPVPI